MEFRILGPLEVWEGGRPLELRRPTHRALLAALLLRAGQALSVDQLLDDLWGERPPPTAKGSLQNMVSALRKLLGELLLRTQPPGYLLEVERDEVDLFRFERLLKEAQDEAEGAERVARLREALALWRGPPRADLAFVVLEAPASKSYGPSPKKSRSTGLSGLGLAGCTSIRIGGFVLSASRHPRGEGAPTSPSKARCSTSRLATTHSTTC
jgi:hypothetical protein